MPSICRVGIRSNNLDALGEFIYKRTYARYIPEEGRRESWPETVNRYGNWLFKDKAIPSKVIAKSLKNVLDQKVLGSMRATWTAGPAADNDNAVIYNCAYLNVEEIGAFGECLYLLMCGTGVGFSVEDKHISKLPKVEYQKNQNTYTHIIDDSRLGWKVALDKGLEAWWHGRDIVFDFSCLRPMGAPLKTMGGRSSGGEVLRQLLAYARELILSAQGRQLTSFECHSLMCQVAAIVVVGGTRRSALISLSDLEDTAIRNCKRGTFHPRLYGANNSATFYSKPDMLTFLDEWVALAKSGSGERGIANLWAARKNAPTRRKGKLIQGMNPCGEVTLRNREFCNLVEVVVRTDDDFESLRDKVTTAAWLGTIQSTFDYFPALHSDWHDNAVDERLVGISLSGQMDNPDLLSGEVLKLLRQHATNTCRKAAKILNINMPASCTTVKPAGTTSQVVNSSAGIHPRYSPYYVRNVMISTNDPLFAMMRDQGAPIFYPKANGESTAVIQFPVASPKNAITRHDMSAPEQLEWYLKNVTNWTDMNASATVYVDQHEWLSVANWVYDHFDRVNGLTFFPKMEHDNLYEWTPFQEIQQDEYEALAEKFPSIDYEQLSNYEKSDQGDGAKELACAGGACEL